QDKEYAEALRQQMEAEKVDSHHQDANDDAVNQQEQAKAKEDVDVVVDEPEKIELDPLPEEPLSFVIVFKKKKGNMLIDTKTTLRARIRLPNGIRCTRLFSNSSTLSEMKLWVNHELIDNNLAHVVNRFRLGSTYPRTVYDENDKTMEQLGFWRPNTSRTLETPMLYVEEFPPTNKFLSGFLIDKQLTIYWFLSLSAFKNFALIFQRENYLHAFQQKNIYTNWKGREARCSQIKVYIKKLIVEYNNLVKYIYHKQIHYKRQFIKT
ncbi:hypothetical protein RFI_04920, partial [Reticulomyxa filosa]